MESMTVKALLGYVEAFDRAEGATRANHSLYLTLLNQGRRELARAIGGVYTTWTNAIGGALTISGGSCAMPKDLLGIESAWWDGVELTFRATTVMDRSLGDWRNDSASSPVHYSTEGHRIFFDAGSTGSNTGLLEVHGWGLGEDFSEGEEAANPLDDLAGVDDLLPAYFAIWRLPIRRLEPVSNEPPALRAAAEENARRTATRAEYRDLWLAGKDEAAATAVGRIGRPYSGR